MMLWTSSGALPQNEQRIFSVGFCYWLIRSGYFFPSRGFLT